MTVNVALELIQFHTYRVLFAERKPYVQTADEAGDGKTGRDRHFLRAFAFMT
jgi:hypothetical protein